MWNMDLMQFSVQSFTSIELEVRAFGILKHQVCKIVEEWIEEREREREFSHKIKRVFIRENPFTVVTHTNENNKRMFALPSVFALYWKRLGHKF